MIREIYDIIILTHLLYKNRDPIYYFFKYILQVSRRKAINFVRCNPDIINRVTILCRNVKIMDNYLI